MLVDTSAQNNLSIALRHILQQLVDSTNPNGHKNTDMTLPYDGYIQKLSWYFECDKCHYKAFYSHDMENHKHTCMLSRDFKSQFKKRKVTAPKRVSSTTHPPNEDSDHDSQSAVNPPPVPPPLQASFPADRSISTPMTVRSSSIDAVESSIPTLTTSQAHSNIVSMEPASIEFDADIASPEYIATPTIPEHDSETNKSLDFDVSLQKTETQTDEDNEDGEDNTAQPQPFDFDPDILEIKVEVNEGQEASSSSTAAAKDTSADPSLLPTDILFPPSDASIDSMMSMFTSQTSTQSMPSIPSTSTPRHPPPFKAASAMRPEFPRNTLPSIQNVRMPTGPLSTSYPNVATHSQHLHRPRLPYMQQQLQRQQQQQQIQQQQHQSSSQSSAYKESMSDHLLMQRILCSHGKVVNISQVRYTINNKNHEKCLGVRIEVAMRKLADAGYGYYIKSRFFKNPRLTDPQLACYRISRETYDQRLRSDKGFQRIRAEKLEKLHELHRTLF